MTLSHKSIHLFQNKLNSRLLIGQIEVLARYCIKITSVFFIKVVPIRKFNGFIWCLIRAYFLSVQCVRSIFSECITRIIRK